MQYRHGLTIIEVLFSICMVILLAVIGLASMNIVNGPTYLSMAKNNTLSLLHTAKTEALIRSHNQTHGIYIDDQTNNIIQYQGNSYTGRIMGSETQYQLPHQINVTNINLNASSNDIVFQQRTGQTNNFGSFEIMNDSGIYTIYIDARGTFTTDFSTL